MKYYFEKYKEEYFKVLYGMIDTNDYYLAVGDMNHSGRLDITDITVLVKTLYGLI